jgi:glucosamine 6-phosphate synthetase-like amidotransferase/phosphosugar isomerase protein
LQSTLFTSGTVKVIALGDCGFIVVDEGRVRKYDKDGNLQSTIFTSGTVTVTVVPPCDFIVMDDAAYVNMMQKEIYKQPYLHQVQAVWYLPVMADLSLLTMVGYASMIRMAICNQLFLLVAVHKLFPMQMVHLK